MTKWQAVALLLSGLALVLSVTSWVFVFRAQRNYRRHIDVLLEALHDRRLQVDRDVPRQDERPEARTH